MYGFTVIALAIFLRSGNSTVVGLCMHGHIYFDNSFLALWGFIPSKECTLGMQSGHNS